jgi:hypothetical protein
MHAWRGLDPRLTARLLERLVNPRRPLPRWLERIRLGPNSYWPFRF